MNVTDLYHSFINVGCDTKISIIDNKTGGVLFYGLYDEIPYYICSLNVVGFSFGEVEELDEMLRRELKTFYKAKKLRVYVRY